MKTTAKLLLGCFGLLVGLTCVAAAAAILICSKLRF